MPIVLGAITVLLSIALLVGWTLVIIQNTALTQQVTQNTWLLVSGIVSLAVIIAVLVVLCVFLVRETLQVRRQDSFIASVTHELKSPLASIKLCLETLQRSEVSEAQAREVRQMMAEDIERLASFIDDILAASGIATAERGYEVREVHLEPLAMRCARAVEARYSLTEGAIHVDVPPELRLQSDPTVLETVLKNLLDNAVKYSNPPACVRVVCAPSEGRYMALEVSDRGIGIPKAQLKRVFDRFYRVPTESVRSRRGTGLGLFVVSSLVRGIGGRLQARSAGEGKGTTMRVLLPG